MTGVPVSVCARCRRVVFPARELCPGCGSSHWHRDERSAGVVEDATVVERAPRGLRAGARVGTVRLDDGPRLVARLGPGAEIGARVRVVIEEGAPVALRYPV